ncbi:uncharacterized protein CCOS01_09732 [Colletotrichum costaricense]|uniref:Uncharacterized protein n=1 Tax=Colletotrichum costaricense TaxID=1209916 RepID=A0AAI9YSF5_9PEZI|nr:uncharacterized protein CCOS01_09732 [Colletotrichum costaricense]KAK1522020.1 hypothetical protein CCOS01_09732 [Colletotrichum costaricense]
MWSGGVDNGIGGRERRGVCVGSGRCAQKRRGRANMRGVKGGVRGREGRRTWKRPGRIGGGGRGRGLGLGTWDLTPRTVSSQKGLAGKGQRALAAAAAKHTESQRAMGKNSEDQEGETGKGKPKVKLKGDREKFSVARAFSSFLKVHPNYFFWAGAHQREERDGAATAKLKGRT